jgi:hypothetical protein
MLPAAALRTQRTDKNYPGAAVEQGGRAAFRWRLEAGDTL